ncbi:MAG TPA: aconitate hydratase AcnA [Dehalococcoidia bacterium]|nr:aconitate hydratase AcnA [Dehalococcoidia bacterium]
MPTLDSFNTRTTLNVAGRIFTYYNLQALTRAGLPDVSRLPYSLRILLENLMRSEDGVTVTKEDIAALASWDAKDVEDREVAFRPARVLMQDLTGVPAIVDLAAMRDAMVALGGDPKKINPLQPAELVIDHSVQVDEYGTSRAFFRNAELELERNRERYALLRWGQQALSNFKVVPPDTGIVHQVNLESLGRVVFQNEVDGELTAYPDTVIGTDSHTTMINGLGVLGWGVGGIEAEASLLGQPSPMLIPEVIGMRLTGRLREGATATDLVLTVTEILRKRGVVGKFVEFCGSGLSGLPLADRATIGNMAPEYGATAGYFPVDDETLRYMRFTGRSEEQVQLVEAYCRAQGLFRTDDKPEPVFTDLLELNLGDVVPSIAGPRRPQDRVALTDAKQNWRMNLTSMLSSGAHPDSERISAWTNESPAAKPTATAVVAGDPDRDPFKSVTTDAGFVLGHGAVVVAAITSCTNTSNPQVLMAAGLLARNAAQKGLRTKPWVKTSLAPGSKVVTDYLDEARLTPYLDQLGFNLVGYGCTTCIGNSGPLPEEVATAVEQGDLVVASVLSGNRNFEGRIHQLVRANYLASPPLVVAYALAGHMDVDFDTDPLGNGSDGRPVFLRDIWPTRMEIEEAIREGLKTEMFRSKYADVFSGDASWRDLDVPQGDLFDWDAQSTYVRKPPYFDGMTMEVTPRTDIRSARVLGLFGDSVTTDHVSPAGEIARTSPAGTYLTQHEVPVEEYNTYGARRGNHEAMGRGTFANIRLKNGLVPGVEGWFTKHLPDGEEMSIWDASMLYQADGVPLVVLGGKEYGTGSSRDWAAKGPRILGVKAVIVESFERIHRSNLIGMGVLPLQFLAGESVASLGLTGEEVIDIEGLANMQPRQQLSVKATSPDGSVKTFNVVSRIDTPIEVDYYNHDGILPYVLRQLAKS